MDVLSHMIGINYVRIASNVMKQIVTSFKESWRRCINVFFSDNSYQFFKYDHVRIRPWRHILTFSAKVRRDNNCSIFIILLLKQQMTIYQEGSGIKNMVWTVNLSFQKYIEDLLRSDTKRRYSVDAFYKEITLYFADFSNTFALK